MRQMIFFEPQLYSVQKYLTKMNITLQLILLSLKLFFGPQAVARDRQVTENDSLLKNLREMAVEIENGSYCHGSRN